MAQQIVNLGTTANDGTGDPLRTAFDKANDNFVEVYHQAGMAWDATRAYVLNDFAKVNSTVYIAQAASTNIDPTTDTDYSHWKPANLAELIQYSNTVSGLTATNVQGAVDEVVANLKNRNVLINGDFRVNQREFAGDWSVLADGDYGYDRWKKLGTNIQQVVEDVNFVNDAVYTLSYWVGSVQTVSQITAPASGHWTITVPNTATKIQLELGTLSTPFELRPIGEELALCQRYYERYTVTAGGRPCIVYMHSANVGRADFRYSTPKRASPTLLYVNAGIILEVDGTSNPVTSVSTAETNHITTLIAFGIATSRTLSNAGTIVLTNAADYISFDAEL